MESKARSRALPALPDEIWCMIASWLSWMPDQKRWQPWVLSRTVNRTFKRAIEQYHIDTWLPGSSIIVDCEDNSSVWDASEAASRRYIFDGFAGHSHGLAVYVSAHGRDGLEVEIERRLFEYSERGYHPYLLIKMENGATDMLPMDLEYPSVTNGSRFLFDWRTYLCTLFSEIQAADEWEDLGTSERSVVSMVPEVYQKYDWAEGDGTNAAGMQDLIKAAGTMLVGKDGRLLELRRNRRARLGWQSGQLVRRDGRPSRLEQRRFQTMDEERVAEKLLALQREAASGGFPLQW